MRILVIDDNAAFRSMLAEWLRKEGHDAGDMNGDFESLTHHDFGQYDVLILDLMMPKANGLTLISRIREAHPRTRIIVVSAAADVRVAIQATKEGAEACLEKPVDFECLRNELNRLEAASPFEPPSCPVLSLFV
jgi:two-component system nitrogen regulation response regulator GlnG